MAHHARTIHPRASRVRRWLSVIGAVALAAALLAIADAPAAAEGPAPAALYYASPDGSDDPGATCGQVDDPCSLARALDVLVPGTVSTIYLVPARDGGSVFTTDVGWEVSTAGDVAMEPLGAGTATLDGQGVAPHILEVFGGAGNSVNLRLRRIEISGSQVRSYDLGESSGGGIHVHDGASLLASDCIFRNNAVRALVAGSGSAISYGGAILNDGGLVGVEGCLFVGNDVTATAISGSGLAWGGSITNI
ncbi:MAG TPA: hypothetical protein VFQ96_03350, partial [Microbacteriaceae bacterium]|nr:hypothetical protein [Microbacteriaceae bacterium]